MTTAAVPRPRVFISSTIADFRDLRSALRFWLEQAGYDVQLSEYNDFDRRPEDGVFEACFNNVASSDYYILLIGRNRGSPYRRAKNLTVTRQEFRTAVEAARSRQMGIFVLVREEVAVALEQWQKSGSPEVSTRYVEHPAFTHEFLQEVQRPSRRGSGPRWFNRFSDFRDIVDALRVPLRLDLNIQRRLLQENLLSELLYNLSLMVTKTGYRTCFPHHWYSDSVRRGITVREDDTGGQIWLTSDQLGRLGLIALGHPGGALGQDAISEALRSGLFLNVDRQTGEFEYTEAQEALASLHRDIRSLASWAKDRQVDAIMNEFLSLVRQANRGELPGGSEVSADRLTVLLAIHDRTEDVFKGIAKFAQWLLGASESPSIVRNPQSPVEGASEAIEAERVTASELRWALTEGVHPFGYRLTPELHAEVQKRATGRFVQELRAFVSPDVVSDEALAEVVSEALGRLVVEPSPRKAQNEPLGAQKDGQA